MPVIDLTVAPPTIIRFLFPTRSFLASEPLAMVSDDHVFRGNKAYSHWVRITSCPICSMVVPGTGSYNDRPIAWICSVLLLVSARSNVRFNRGRSESYNIITRWNTITRAGKKPLCDDVVCHSSQKTDKLTLHLVITLTSESLCVVWCLPIAMSRSGLNSRAIWGVELRIRLWMSL